MLSIDIEDQKDPYYEGNIIITQYALPTKGAIFVRLLFLAGISVMEKDLSYMDKFHVFPKGCLF